MAVVDVVFLKYDGRAHRSYPARYLGEDEYGTWLGVAGGHPARVDGDQAAVRHEPYVLLVPEHAWWTAMFNAPPAPDRRSTATSRRRRPGPAGPR